MIQPVKKFANFEQVLILEKSFKIFIFILIKSNIRKISLLKHNNVIPQKLKKGNLKFRIACIRRTTLVEKKCLTFK